MVIWIKAFQQEGTAGANASRQDIPGELSRNIKKKNVPTTEGESKGIKGKVRGR